LDLMISEVFSNLNDSMIFYFFLSHPFLNQTLTLEIFVGACTNICVFQTKYYKMLSNRASGG